MEIIFTDKAKADIAWWKKLGNVFIFKQISSLLQSISETPFTGIEKPEPLKHNLAGTWSRRVTQEHRLVNIVEIENIIIVSLRHHY